MPDLIESAAVPFAPLIGLAPLMRSAVRNEDLTRLGAVLLARAQSHPDDANAFLDCSILMQLMGNRDIAMAMQTRALHMQDLYALPAQRPGPGLRLLVIKGPGEIMWNTPIEFLVEDSDVSADLLYLTMDGHWPESVPDHDVMFVAVSESEANQPLLEQLASFVAQWPRPVINLPERIAALSRDGACALLQDIEGVVMPATLRVDRTALQRLATGAVPGLPPLGPGMPLIVRPLDSHAGKNLDKISSREEVLAYLAKVGGDHFYLSRFVDYSGSDGLFRKYRIVLIEGRPFVCHMAVSEHWMIHYLNAGMLESEQKRAEEAECMRNFDQEFALRHAASLLEIYDRLGLPYVGIDCAELPTGELLIFEVGNAMVVHALDDEHIFPYKKPAMRRVFSAFRQMLENARPAPPTA
jgi:glutathione synthase/RimK-type ligase-like ATP-grasp enzyme